MGFHGIEYFSRDLIRKYVIVFGTLFNNMTVERTNAAGNRVQTLEIPLAYAPKEKVLARVNTDPDLDQQVAVQLPRMSFELTDIQYDSARQLNKNNKFASQSQTNRDQNLFAYEPAPYLFQFQLHIFVKNANDGTKILEQILPYFMPEWTPSVIIDSDLGLTRDIPIILNNVTSEDSYDGDFESRRALVWTLDFTMKAYIYGPTKNAELIKKVIIDVSDVERIDGLDNVTVEETESAARKDRITITPGLTSANTPTSNSALTVDYSLIKATDNYGFVVDFDSYSDGSKFNPVTGEDE